MKKLFPWLILGLLIRLYLMPTVIHPDIRGFNLAAYFITQKGETFTFYDHISKLPRTDRLVEMFHDDLFIYPPLAYLSHAFFMWILSPVYPWDAFHQMIDEMSRLPELSSTPLLLFLLKLPYLVADFLCLLVLRKIVAEKHQFITSVLWIFNPITIYASYMISQFDIFIALFLLLGVWFSSRGKPWATAITFGLAAGFKPFPLFFLLFIPAKNLFHRIWHLLLGVFVYLGIIAPYLNSPGFKQYALLANQTDKLLYARIMVSGSQYLPLFFVGLFLLFWWNYYRSRDLPFWGWMAAVTLLFYSVSLYHPQWFVWGVSFLLLGLVYRPATRILGLVMFACYLITVLLFEPSLNFGLFNLDFSLSSWLDGKFPPDQFASLIKAVFAASAVTFISQLKSDDNPTS